jgi:hypothetical protein
MINDLLSDFGPHSETETVGMISWEDGAFHTIYAIWLVAASDVCFGYVLFHKPPWVSI